MKENENKELEELIGKAMKNMPLETPPLDFTSRVMAQAAITPKKAILTYKPILPKSFWLVLSITIVGLFCFAYFSETSQGGIVYGIDLEQTYNSKFQQLTSQLDFSKTTMYATVALLLAMLVQILFFETISKGNKRMRY